MTSQTNLNLESNSQVTLATRRQEKRELRSKEKLLTSVCNGLERHFIAEVAANTAERRAQLPAEIDLDRSQQGTKRRFAAFRNLAEGQLQNRKFIKKGIQFAALRSAARKQLKLELRQRVIAAVLAQLTNGPGVPGFMMRQRCLCSVFATLRIGTTFRIVINVLPVAFTVLAFDEQSCCIRGVLPNGAITTIDGRILTAALFLPTGSF
ncbi:hypothetical protein A374_14245 [Fictibacillus macauensis ZFHKF-1]|uniref:Uncharacterized protein n=1 Tax=Fictibacillus macauensis ZFHKF-1 TaxID=1196324 RepID=I8AHD8_9BACL|nr:hypothetical protein [Fictibacillus macauensis]EIT84859.1 hypothetical protein A374_14245 [Fictibacillus macauensis ZFHKF-1]